MRYLTKIILFALLIALSVQLAGQEIQFGNSEQESLTDGPYIFWHETEAVVQYILNNNFVTQSIPITDNEPLIFSLEGLEGEFEICRKEKITEPYIYNKVSKIFAISDVHGQYDRMVQILQNNGIIDADNNWSWQNGHLVVLGDVFDRGPKVTESLWLIHKLENQAEEWKGKVHFLLGNHEVMVLQGDDRYVHDRYKQVAEKLEMAIPELFGKKSEFGRWLRSKNTVIKINDMLFCHAGINPKIWNKNYSINDINNMIRLNIDLPKEQIKEQEDLKLLFGSNGPLWYRGYFTDSDSYDQISQIELWLLLDEMAVSHIIIGHTTQDFINPFFKDRVIPIDSGIKYGDHGEGLLWKDDIFYRAKANGETERVIY